MSKSNGHKAAPLDEGFVTDDTFTIALTPEEFPVLSQEHQVVLRMGITVREASSLSAQASDDPMSNAEQILARLIVSWTFGRELTAESIALLNPNIYLKLMKEANAYFPLVGETTPSEPVTAPS